MVKKTEGEEEEFGSKAGAVIRAKTVGFSGKCFVGFYICRFVTWLLDHICNNQELILEDDLQLLCMKVIASVLDNYLDHQI